jgi:hypothetical protein
MSWSDGAVTRTRALQLLSGVLLAWGAVLVARPRAVASALAPEYPADRDWVVRVLGARQVVQHGVLLAAHDRPLTYAGVGVDVLHALSMLPFTRSPRYRRAALVSGGTAAASAALTAALAGRSQQS